MLYLCQNYKVFCPACGTAIETNEHGERHCTDCDLWYTDQQLFGYQPRHLTPLALDGANAPDFQQSFPADVLDVDGVLPEPPRQ